MLGKGKVNTPIAKRPSRSTPAWCAMLISVPSDPEPAAEQTYPVLWAMYQTLSHNLPLRIESMNEFYNL